MLLILATFLYQDEIADLIRKLSDDDIAVRDAATEALFKRGDTVRKALEEASRSEITEVSTRAKDLLSRLDVAANVRKLEKLSGRLGETGVFWVESQGFDLVADERNLLPWMKPALVEGDAPVFVRVYLDESRSVNAEAVIAHLKDTEAGRMEHQHRASPVSFCKVVDFGKWFEGIQKPQGTECFRRWPRLRKSSVVFVSVSSLQMPEGLKVALHDDR